MILEGIFEGQMLLAILIVVALAMAALGVYIRFGMKRSSSDADIILSRFLGFGNKAEAGEEPGAAAQEASARGKPGAGMPSAPGTPKAGPAPADKKGLLSGLGGLVGARKTKEQIKEEEKLIDSQLNQVLQLTEEITRTDNGMPSLTLPDRTPAGTAAPGLSPLTMPDNSAPMSMPSLTLPDNGMPALTMPDNGMPSLTMPDNGMPPLAPPDAPAPGGMPSLDLPDVGIQLTLPDPGPAPAPAAEAPPAPAPAPYKSDGTATKKLCKEYIMPEAPLMPGDDGLKLSAGGIDFSPDKDKDKNSKDGKGKKKTAGQTTDFSDFGGKKKDKKDDLLSDLEEEASKELEVDMSIMKDFKDLSITCDELEDDLKGIMDQINLKTGGRKDAQA